MIEFEAMLRRQFDTLYREGETILCVMAIAVHPFVTGQPHRIIEIDGKRHLWRGLVQRRREQLTAAAAPVRFLTRRFATSHRFFIVSVS